MLQAKLLSIKPLAFLRDSWLAFYDQKFYQSRLKANKFGLDCLIFWLVLGYLGQALIYHKFLDQELAPSNPLLLQPLAELSQIIPDLNFADGKLILPESESLNLFRKQASDLAIANLVDFYSADAENSVVLLAREGLTLDLGLLVKFLWPRLNAKKLQPELSSLVNFNEKTFFAWPKGLNGKFKMTDYQNLIWQSLSITKYFPFLLALSSVFIAFIDQLLIIFLTSLAIRYYLLNRQQKLPFKQILRLVIAANLPIIFLKFLHLISLNGSFLFSFNLLAIILKTMLYFYFIVIAVNALPKN